MSPQTSSRYWKYFKICEDDVRFAFCLLCGTRISRGGDGKKASTTPLKNHIERKHAEHYATLAMKEDTRTSLTKLTSKTTTHSPTSSAVKQTPLKEMSRRKGLWRLNDPKSIKFHYLIGEMIALDNEQLSFVERTGFLRLMEQAVPQYKMPDSAYMAETIIPDMYRRICSKIEAGITQSTAVSVTSDMWMSQQNYLNFLCFTAHWISSPFNLQHGVLAIGPFDWTQTGANIVEEFNSIADKWNIPQGKINLLIHDTANTVKGVSNAKYASAKCFIGLLEGAIQESLLAQQDVSEMISAARRIVIHINHSEQAQEKLRIINQNLDLPDSQLVQDVSTRWNSTYYLFLRMIEQKPAISLLTADLESLTQFQWELMQQCVHLLQPFEEITKITSSGFSCISEVIPHFSTLLKYLRKEETADQTPQLKTMRSSLLAGLQSRFKFENEDKYIVATFLDPRYKISFLGQVQAEKAKQTILLDAIKLSCETNKDQDVYTPSDQKSVYVNQANTAQNSFWQCFDEVATEGKSGNPTAKTKNTVAHQIDLYLSIERLDRTEDIYRWWAANSQTFPDLVVFARKYLSCPGSIVYNEPVFSEPGLVYEEKRDRQLSENAQNLFIQHNLPLVSFDY